MKATNKLIIAAVATGAVAAFVLYAIRRKEERLRLEQVSDEGYETAHDILFPGKKNRGQELRYGVVLPE